MGERVLGDDGRFYNPLVQKEYHVEQVAIAKQRAKMEKLDTLEANLREEGKKLKVALAEMKVLVEHNHVLEEENERLRARVEAFEVAGRKASVEVKDEEPVVIPSRKASGNKDTLIKNV